MGLQFSDYRFVIFSRWIYWDHVSFILCYHCRDCDALKLYCFADWVWVFCFLYTIGQKPGVLGQLNYESSEPYVRRCSCGIHNTDAQTKPKLSNSFAICAKIYPYEQTNLDEYWDTPIIVLALTVWFHAIYIRILPNIQKLQSLVYIKIYITMFGNRRIDITRFKSSLRIANKCIWVRGYLIRSRVFIPRAILPRMRRGFGLDLSFTWKDGIRRRFSRITVRGCELSRNLRCTSSVVT